MLEIMLVAVVEIMIVMVPERDYAGNDGRLYSLTVDDAIGMHVRQHKRFD